MESRTYGAGETISEEGEVALEGFRIISGKVEVGSFPYRIGCRFIGSAPPFMRNDLLLEDTMPGYISRDHCAIERNSDTIYLRDRGSAAGTMVNGQSIGTAAGVVTAPLNLGENVVVFGGADSPHRFFLHVVSVG